MSDIIGAATTGGTGIAQAITGSIQYFGAQEELEKALANRPEYQIPEELRAMVDLYRRESQQTRLPGQDIYEQRIYGSTAAGVGAAREAATSAGDVLGATTQLYGQQSAALSDLEIAAAQRQEQQQARYAQSLETLAQYQDKAWNWNVAIPYQQDLQRYSSAVEQGYQTWLGGSNLIAESGAMISGSDFGGGTETSSSGGGFDMSSFQ
jgi:hypothetical protein